jgi:hypothetical protein
MSGIDSVVMISWTMMFMAMDMMAFIFKDLGKRIGDALHLKKYYLIYDLSIDLSIISLIMMLSVYVAGVYGTVVPYRDNIFTAGIVLFLVTAVLVVWTTVRYWGWIVPEVIASLSKRI